MHIYDGKYIMQNLFKFLPDLDAVRYTEYFLNDFFIEHNSYKELEQQPYILFDGTKFNKGLSKELNRYLMLTFKFPPLSNALVFKHFSDQPIHVDGTELVRNASLNLPLIGYENTRMIFYRSSIKTEDITPTDAFYFPEDSLEYCGEFPGENNWVLINSSIPHQVINSQPENPRITICFRFRGNPSFEDLCDRIDNTKC
jgi:hypothetical protein